MIPLVYDQVNRWARDDEFFMELLKKVSPQKIADLGCGTGRLTTHFSEAGYQITAIDPNEEAIECAKRKAYPNDIMWIVGDSSNLEDDTFDTVIMTANVAQVFLTDESWQHVLSDVYRALKPGGHLIFDTRNPSAKAWEQWEKDETPDHAIDDQNGEPLLIWTEYEGFKENVYSFYETVVNARTDTVLVREKIQLRFRSYEETAESLQAAGFASFQVYHEWKFEEANPNTKSFVFHAVK